MGEQGPIYPVGANSVARCIPLLVWPVLSSRAPTAWQRRFLLIAFMYSTPPRHREGVSETEKGCLCGGGVLKAVFLWIKSKSGVAGPIPVSQI